VRTWYFLNLFSNATCTATLRRAVMGSVSRHVMDHSAVPVLVVRQRDAKVLG
jgi:hypothetical protein